MFASYWMIAMSGQVITKLTAQMPRITSRECRVVSLGVRGCRMLMYLRSNQTLIVKLWPQTLKPKKPKRPWSDTKIL